MWYTSSLYLHGNPFDKLGTGLTWAAYNQNPGNLTDDSGKFRKFDSPEDGYQALIDDIKAKQTGNTKTGLNGQTSLVDFIRHYAPASDKNDPVTYAQNVAKTLTKAGIPTDTSTAIGTIPAEQLAPHIAHVEDHTYFDTIKDRVASIKATNPFDKIQDTSPNSNTSNSTALTTASGDNPFDQIGKKPELIKPISDLYQSGKSGYLGAAIDAPNTIIKNVVNTGIGGVNTLARANSQTPFGDSYLLAGNAIKDVFSGSGGIGGAAKGILSGLWNMATSSINVGADIVKQEMPELAPVISALTQAGSLNAQAGFNFNLNDKERYNQGSQVVAAGFAALVSHNLGAALGETGGLAEFNKALNIPDGASALDVVTKHIPDALEGMPMDAKISLLKTLANPAKDIVTNGMTNGAAGGAAFALASQQDPSNTFQNVFQMGLLGGALGSVFGNKVNAKNPLYSDAIKDNIIKNVGITLTPDNALSLSDALAQGKDLVGAIKQNMNPGSVMIATGLPTIRDSHFLDEDLGVHKRNDGSYDVMITSPTSDESSSNGTGTNSPISPADLSQFNREGFVQNEGVSHEGNTGFIYDGLVRNGDKSLARIKSIVDGETELVDPEKLRRTPLFHRITLDDNNNATLDPTTGAVSRFVKPVYDDLSTPDKAAVDEVRASNLIERKAVGDVTASQLVNDGYYISTNRGTDGSYIIKSLSDPTFSSVAPKMEDVQQFILSRASAANASSLIDKVQNDAVPDLQVAQRNAKDLAPIPASTNSRPVSNWINTNAIGTYFTPMTKLFASISRQTGIEFGDKISRLEDANRKLTADRTTIGAIAKTKLAGLTNLNPNQQIQAEDLATAMSAEEALGGKFYADGRQMHPDALPIARAMIDVLGGRPANPLDAHEALVNLNTGVKYNREVSWLKGSNLSPDELASRIGDLQQSMNITDMHKQISDILDKSMDSGVKGLEPTSLADMLLTNSPSRAEYIRIHNIPDNIVSAIAAHDEMYKMLSDRLGIKNPLNNYVPRLVKYTGADFRLEQSQNNFRYADPKDIHFANDLSRVGFYNPAEIYHDLPQIFNQYLNRGLKAETVAPIIEEIRNQLNDEYANNPTNRPTINKIYTIIERLKDDINGQHNPLDNQIQSTLDAEAAKGSKFGNLWNNLTRMWAFKGVGFRPIVGFRHFASALYSAAMSFGPSFASEMLENINKSLEVGKDLQKKGITPGGVVDQLTNSVTPSNSSLATRVVNKSFKVTGLGQIYQTLHASAYLTMTKRIGSALSDYAQGNLKPEELAKKIQLNLFDPGDQKEFSKRVEDGDLSGATDYLARRAGEKVVGHFGVVNNPLLLRNTPGRLFGQFGSYKMYQIQQIMDAISNGDGASRAKRATFILGSGMALAGLSKASGVDLNQFSLWDASKIFDMAQKPPQSLQELGGRVISSTLGNTLPPESPASQFMVDLNDANNPDSPTSHYSAKKLGDLLFNPLPAEINNLVEAGARFNNGDPLQVVGMKLLGGNIDTKVYHKPNFSLWDLW